LAESKELCPDLAIKNIVLDATHDNYPTYHLCNDWNIIPFINLNPSNSGNLTYPGAVTVDENGIPVCIGDHHRVNWGLRSDKTVTNGATHLPVGKSRSVPASRTAPPLNMTG